MIKAYVAGIPSYNENEEIEVRLKIYKDEEILVEKKEYQRYKKPTVVNYFALVSMLKTLRKMPSEDIEIVIHDASLLEQLRGTSATKNADVIKAGLLVQNELDKFSNEVKITDVTSNFQAKKEWDKEVSF